MSQTMHPFERAGLGKAPFTYKGTTHEVGPIQYDDGTIVGAPGQPMGTCDYCGQGIANVVRVQSADGKLFKIGVDCAMKLAKETNREFVKSDPIYGKIRAAARRHATEVRHAREDRKIAEGVALYAAHRDFFAAMPHPVPYWADQGQTYADRIDWMLANSGNAGKLRTIHEVAAAIAAGREV